MNLSCVSKAFLSLLSVLGIIVSTMAKSETIAIGLDADFSGSAKQGAFALKQGAEVAIEEINASGGVLGRRLRLVTTDHKANPRRGVHNFASSVRNEHVVAMLTGVHSPVAIAQLEPAHALRVPLISPWAAATQFVSNGQNPNYAFRVSIRDEHAAGFLIGEALTSGYRRIGLLLENTPWGTSNEVGLRAAVTSAGIAEIVSEEWFGFGDTKLDDPLREVLNGEPDVIVLVANPREGAAVVRAMASLPAERQVPILSHWGVTAGDMKALTDGDVSRIDFRVLQTHSFFSPDDGKVASAFLDLSCRLHSVCAAEDVVSHTGMAHAYDSVHLVARAIESAGTADPNAVRDALSRGTSYRGLVRNYTASFDPDRHEALNRSDFRLVRYDEGGRLRP